MDRAGHFADISGGKSDKDRIGDTEALSERLFIKMSGDLSLDSQEVEGYKNLIITTS